MTPPSLVSATVSPNGEQINLVFSEDLVIPARGVVAFLDTIAGSFSVTAAGSPLSVARAIATSASTRILTLPVSPDIGQGQAVVVSYTDPTAGDDDVALEDAGGNETPSFTTGSGGVPAVTNNSTVDLTGPSLVSATVSPNGEQINLVFSEDLVIPARGVVAFLDTIAGSFSVTAAGSPLSVARAIATSASTRILTLPVSPDIGQGQAVVVSYTDPTAGDDDVALEDAGGNETPSFTTGSGGVPAVTNNSTVDLTGPSLVSATVSPNGEQINLVFSEDLVIPARGVVAFLDTIAGSFSVTAAGSPLSVARAIATSASTRILTLPVSPDIGQDQAVVVSYTDPTAGDDDVALEDADGNETPSFTTGSGGVPAVTNNSTVTDDTALTSVTVTSTPRKTTDTYGAREHIEFSMTFDAPVTVTGDPTFAFDLGGASTATYYAGSGTATLRFSHAVSGGSSGDLDTNGISWAANAIALNGGTIAGTDNAVAAILTHVAQSNLAGHKVDGRTTAVTPATVTVAVTSTPTSLADTYGFGETIVITVTASEAVEVEGDPVFLFSLTDMGGAANDVPATYDGTRSSPTTIVFTYTVQAGDRDNNGIWIGNHSRTFRLDANDRIRTASQQIDIDRSHPEKGTHDGHKVDGSLGAPTVPPDPTPPTLVSATATTLTIEWTHPGDGGSPLTRNFIEYRVEGTTDWTNWYRGETPTPVTRTVIRNLAAATAYDVRVHSRNAIGNSQWTQSATAFSTLAGTAATGAPTITGTAAVGQPLAVDLTGIADADGLTNVSYSYQWVRVDADGMSNPADITDATDATYTLVDADLGTTLKVRVTFDDDGGNTETLTSAATATVTPAAGAPNSPRNLSATVGVGQVVLVWQHPPGGGGGVTRSSYEYRFSAGEMISPDAMWQQALRSPGTPNQAYYLPLRKYVARTNLRQHS